MSRLENKTVAELKKEAKSKGIHGYSSMRKQELVSILGSKKSSKSSPRGKLPPQKFAGDRSLSINKYFSRIFIINLRDKEERFQKVTKQFLRKKVKYQRFDAVDGRCTKGTCAAKKKELEKKYKLKIARSVKPPTASLVIGTIQLLKMQVKNKWKRMLICEDDIVFDPRMLARFDRGIDELGDEDWDLLYLGCGNTCGYKGLSEKKTAKTPHMTSLSIVDKEEYNWYVQHPDDLRVIGYPEDVEELQWGKYISKPISPGGTWAYAYSLKGAKKALKFFSGKVSNHIDQMVIKGVRKGELNALSFDPPIIWHEAGAFRPDSDIPWSW
jgi:hypothetical protein